MFEKFKEFVDKYLKEIDEKRMYFRDDEIIYGVKDINDEMRVKFNELKNKENNTKWKIENVAIFNTWKGLNKKGLKEFNKNLVNANGDDIPTAYKEFLKNFNGIDSKTFILYGHNGYEAGPTSIYFNMMEKTPLYIDKDSLNIGCYACDNSPIFMDKQGHIFIYSGTHMFNSQNPGYQDEQKQALIAYWDNIEDFVADETKRAFELFCNNPFLSATTDMLPHNAIE